MILKIIVLFSRQLCAAVLCSTPSTDNNNDTMKTEVTTAKNSKFAAASRKTTMGLRFCGWDNRGCFAMRSNPGTLKDEEALIVREPWTKKPDGSKVRVCYKGDDSERWIERA